MNQSLCDGMFECLIIFKQVSQHTTVRRRGPQENRVAGRLPDVIQAPDIKIIDSTAFELAQEFEPLAHLGWIVQCPQPGRTQLPIQMRSELELPIMQPIQVAENVGGRLETLTTKRLV